jgi:hypothetical protein
MLHLTQNLNSSLASLCRYLSFLIQCSTIKNEYKHTMTLQTCLTETCSKHKNMYESDAKKQNVYMKTSELISRYLENWMYTGEL